MIIKNFELQKIKSKDHKFFLFYGVNEGLKIEIIKKIFLENFDGEILYYEESEILKDWENFISSLLNKSLFEDNKILIISRSTDKIFNFINEVVNRDPDNIRVIIKSANLDKKSKLRNYFEKSKNLVIIPFYEDTFRDLNTLIDNFTKKNNLKISRESINLLIERSSGDRKNLNLELDKILNYSMTNKSISFKQIINLTNLAEQYSVFELADCFLNKNQKKVSNILNENNYSNEDCILILRTILGKLKRLALICELLEKNNNIERILTSFKPPIFWKDKENVKKQVRSWNLEELKNKIYQLNNIELTLKKNSSISLLVTSDFLLNI